VTRFLLIRREDDTDELVPETALPAEADLHDALTAHPELIPAEDLGLGRTVVVGRETAVASGYADLVLIDDQGQLCLVEVKKEGNPDTRRVAAQLLDYAADLWGKSLEEFERSVLSPYLKQVNAGTIPSSLSEFLKASFATEDVEIDANVDIEGALAATLQSGRFVLLVAAPEIPPGVRRVLEYLNAQGLRLFGLEVSYFKGPAEAFVPRIVVSPPPIEPAPTPRVTREWFLNQIPSEVSEFASSLLDAVAERGVEVRWTGYGPSIEARRGTVTRQIVYLSKHQLGVTITPPKGFPDAPFKSAAATLAELSIGAPTANQWSHNVTYAELDSDRQDAVQAVILALCEELAAPIRYQDLAEPLVLAFTRNDYNIWERTVPELVDKHGRYLRGELARESDQEAVAVELQPLAKDAPGWVPRFQDAEAGARMWSAGEYAGAYTLKVLSVGS
jgi:hypothetical protein